MDLKEMSTEALQKEATELDNAINVVECYGVRDVVRLEIILKELSDRGIVAIERLEFIN